MDNLSRSISGDAPYNRYQPKSRYSSGVTEEQKQGISEGFQKTGKFLGDVYQDSKEFKDWRNPLNYGSNIGAAAIRAAEGLVSFDAENPQEIAMEAVDKFATIKQPWAGVVKEIPAVAEGLNKLGRIRDEAILNTGELLGIRPHSKLATVGVNNVNPNVMKIDQRLADFDATRAQRGKIRTEGITRQRLIDEAELKRQANLEKGKPNRAESNIREKRGYLGTPTDFTEGKVKEWIASSPDSRIRERIGRSDAYGKPIAEGAATRGEYPQYPGQKQSKKVNAAIKRDLGLEYTVEQHHLIHLRDSATIGKHLDNLNDPITKAATYDYMLKRFGIVPGNFDLNIANIPAGPHRLAVGGDLHTWLDRLGYEDYWGDFSKKWAGKTPTATDILNAFDVYMDDVFHPMMIKLDDLVKKNPTKGEFKGAYVPEYLVEQAKNRLRTLQKRQPLPSKGEARKAGLSQRELEIEQAYKYGLGDQDTYHQELIGDTYITGIRHHKGPDQPKIKPEVLKKKQLQDKQRGIVPRSLPANY